jgi:phenylacetate-coenzyme A ligase PaaK-like adenylate-forming protein
MIRSELTGRIFNICDQKDFLDIALEIFSYQYDHNPIYQDFCKNLRREKSAVSSLADIPFLPVELFRTQKIITGDSPVQLIFESSGTSGTMPGKHFVTDPELYEECFLKTFRLFYGYPGDYLIIALLPSYTEREGSSLVYMVNKLIEKSLNPESGFYRNNNDLLVSTLKNAKEKNLRILFIGVSYALLDLAESQSIDLSGVIVMETGGMKGRRKELTRQELHTILKEKFNVKSIHSEYGMTELMSQAYSAGDGIYYCPPWMQIMIRDTQDPLSVFTRTGRTGGVNIIDLANINSCSFIATGDLGKLYDDGGFEVLGRFDNSDIRGCNLLAE